MTMTKLKNPANSFLVTGDGEEGFYMIENASTNVHKFTLTPDTPIQIAAVHTLRRQDLTLRVWLSNEPVGLPFYRIPESDRFVNLPRRSYTWVFYPSGTTPPNEKGIQNIELDPGTYYFNVKNLENADNGYRLFFLPILDDGDPREVKC